MCVTRQPLNCVCSSTWHSAGHCLRSSQQLTVSADMFVQGIRYLCAAHTCLPKAALKLHPDSDLRKAPLCCLCTIWTGFPQSFTNTASFCGQVCSEYCFDFLSAGKSVRSYRSRHKLSVNYLDRSSQSFTNTASFCGQVCSEYCFDFLSAGKSVQSYRSRRKTICALFGQIFSKLY